MFLLYLDESGDPNGWEAQKNFILGGVAVHEGQISGLTKKLDEIQGKHFKERSYPINLHATDIHGGRKPPFDELGAEGREQLLSEVYQLIRSTPFPKLILYAVAVHVSWVKSPSQVVRDAFQDICNRFNIMIRRQYDQGHRTKGMLIIDQAHEEQYRELLREFQTEGTIFGLTGNIIDVPYFARSRYTRMIQLADFVTYAVFRHYEAGDQKYLDMIKGNFAELGQDEHHGLNHLTRAFCECEACTRKARVRQRRRRL